MKKPSSHSIKYQQFLFRLTAKEPLILPAYKGATLRGGFGHAFRRVVCAIKDKECADCLPAILSDNQHKKIRGEQIWSEGREREDKDWNNKYNLDYTNRNYTPIIKLLTFKHVL